MAIVKAKEKFCENEKGVELSSVEWLYNHHKAKEEERKEMVADLPINPGDKVLDLACGPGLWSSLLAEKVQPTGQVTGVDFSPDLIKYAQKNKPAKLEKNINFEEGDLYEIPFDSDSFDLVFCGNTFAYINRPIEALEEQKRVAKPGGKVAVKEFDNGAIIFNPIDHCLAQRVMAATAKSLKENPKKPKFDNYIGRKIFGLFKKVGFRRIINKSYAVRKHAPLSEEAKKYIIGTAKWYEETAAPYLTEEERKRWRLLFDPKSNDYILDKEEFYLCMVEMMTIGIVES